MLLCAFSVAVPSQTSGVVVFCTQGLQAALGLHRSHRFRGKVLTVTRFGKSIFQTLKKDSTQAQNSGFLSYDPVKFKCTGKFDIWGSDIGAIGREEGNEEVHGVRGTNMLGNMYDVGGERMSADSKDYSFAFIETESTDLGD